MKTLFPVDDSVTILLSLGATQATEASASCWLVKPFNAGQLLGTISVLAK